MQVKADPPSSLVLARCSGFHQVLKVREKSFALCDRGIVRLPKLRTMHVDLRKILQVPHMSASSRGACKLQGLSHSPFQSVSVPDFSGGRSADAAGPNRSTARASSCENFIASCGCHPNWIAKNLLHQNLG